LNFCWEESGVPEVTSIGEGFGSRLIREIVPQMLGGTTNLEVVGAGIRCVLTMPVPDANIVQGQQQGEGDQS